MKTKRDFSQVNSSAVEALEHENFNVIKNCNLSRLDLKFQIDRNSTFTSKKFKADSVSEINQAELDPKNLGISYNLLSHQKLDFLPEIKKNSNTHTSISRTGVKPLRLDEKSNLFESPLTKKSILSTTYFPQKSSAAKKSFIGNQDWITTETKLRSKGATETTLDRLNAKKNKISFVDQRFAKELSDVARENQQLISSTEYDQTKTYRTAYSETKDNLGSPFKKISSNKLMSEREITPPTEGNKKYRIQSKINRNSRSPPIQKTNGGKNEPMPKNNENVSRIATDNYSNTQDKFKLAITKEKSPSLEEIQMLLEVECSQMSSQAPHRKEDDYEFDEGINDMEFLALLSDNSIFAQHKILVEPTKSPQILKENSVVYRSGVRGHSPIKALGNLVSPKQISDHQTSMESENNSVSNYSSNKDSSRQADNKIQQLDYVGSNSGIRDANHFRGDLSIVNEEGDKFLSSSKNCEKKTKISRKRSGTLRNTILTNKATSTQINVGIRSKKVQGCEETSNSKSTNSLNNPILDDNYEFHDPGPFVGPEFPSPVVDSSPIIGLSSDHILRVCFRIGEMFREAKKFSALKQVPVIELFVRVTHSYRDYATTRQYFCFADLWHNHPPYPSGLLANFKSTELADMESKFFIDNEDGGLSRAIGVLRRDKKESTGWLFYIISIRKTDWEEINWTRRIAVRSRSKSDG